MVGVVRVAYGEVVEVLAVVLRGRGVGPERGAKCGELFGAASRDGVPSHGLNRFAWVANAIQKERIAANAEMQKVAAFGAMERWDGKMGLGPWNAWTCMGRAMALAG